MSHLLLFLLPFYITLRTPSVLLLIMSFSLSGGTVTKVGRACGPTLLLEHVCMLCDKICLNYIFHM